MITKDIEEEFKRGWMARVNNNQSKGGGKIFCAGWLACDNRWDERDETHMTFFDSAFEVFLEGFINQSYL